MSRRARRRRQQTVAAEQPPVETPVAQRSTGSPRFRRGARRVIRLVRRHPVAIAVALLLLHVGLALLTFEPRPHTGGDNAAYITLGRSLLEHGTYTELWDPVAGPHTKYPPVFPAVLAVAMALGLTPWVQLKLVVLSFSAAAVVLSFLWLRRRRRCMTALAVGIILAVAPGILREGRWILSDVPFWAFTMAALWSFERLRPDDWKRFGIGVAAIVLAYFTRSAGLPLVLAALGWLAWRRLWPQLGALAAAVGVPALLWWLRTRAHGPAGYVSEFWRIDPYLPALGNVGPADLLLRMVENVQKYASLHLPILLTGSTGLILTAVGTAICVLALLGWVLRVRRPGPVELFLPLYLGLLFLWPSIWSGERFLLPALPVLLLFAAEGLGRLLRRLLPSHALLGGAAAAALLVFFTVPGLAAGARTGMECTSRYLAGDRYPCLGGGAWDDFFNASELTGVALPGDAVVMNRKPRLLHVLSGGVKSLNYPLSDDAATFFATADSTGARYVIFDRLDAVSEIYLRPILTAHSDSFCLMRVYPTTSTILFGIIRPAPADLPGPGPDGETVGFLICPAEYWRSPEAQQLYEGM